jgi:hypothetical protein
VIVMVMSMKEVDWKKWWWGEFQNRTRRPGRKGCTKADGTTHK